MNNLSDKETLTILLSVFVPGAGHLYLGLKQRGIFIIILNLVLGIFSFSIAFGIPTAVIWIWQFLDILRIIKKEKTISNST